jgi:hypothetical protein
MSKHIEEKCIDTDSIIGWTKVCEGNSLGNRDLIGLMIIIGEASKIKSMQLMEYVHHVLLLDALYHLSSVPSYPSNLFRTKTKGLLQMVIRKTCRPFYLLSHTVIFGTAFVWIELSNFRRR